MKKPPEIFSSISQHSYERYSQDYERQMLVKRKETWYDVHPFSFTLWPQYYSESIRNGRWWRERCNYPLLTLEFMLDGALVFEQSGRKDQVEAGDLYISHPGNTIHIQNAKCLHAHHLQVCISGSLIKLLMESLDMTNTFVIHPDSQEHLIQLMHDIADLMQKHQSGTEATLSEKTYGLLAWLGACKRDERMHKLPPALTHAINYLQAELAFQVSVTDLATMCGVSKATLTRLFRTYLQTSPLSYMNCLRVERAKNLINQGELSLKEIAQQLGYQNALYLSTAFKKTVGLSPSDYRKGKKAFIER